MTAEIFVTDCKISCIFRKFCEVERISGNKPTESIFRDWEWFDGCGIGTPVHRCGVGGRGSGMRIQFWKKELSRVCFHIIMVYSGRMWCVNTTACEWKRVFLIQSHTARFPIRTEHTVTSPRWSQRDSTQASSYRERPSASPVLCWGSIIDTWCLVSNKLWL